MVSQCRSYLPEPFGGSGSCFRDQRPEISRPAADTRSSRAARVSTAGRGGGANRLHKTKGQLTDSARHQDCNCCSSGTVAFGPTVSVCHASKDRRPIGIGPKEHPIGHAVRESGAVYEVLAGQRENPPPARSPSSLLLPLRTARQPGSASSKLLAFCRPREC